MELKQEQVEGLLQFILDQKTKNESENSPAKKATGIIFTVVNLLAFFIVCVISIGYGISSYNQTVEAVETFDGRMKNSETKLTRIDSTTKSMAVEVKIIHELVIKK
jgi:hypothetical protein